MIKSIKSFSPRPSFPSNNFLITKIVQTDIYRLYMARLGGINSCSARQSTITKPSHEGDGANFQAHIAVFDGQSDGYPV
jgi:hypothetical protein